MDFPSMDKMGAFAAAYLADYRETPLSILDVGSAAIGETGTYRAIFDRPPWRYTGLDLQPAANVDLVVKDPYDWRELEDQSFDVVVSGQAFEHIEYIWLTILEVARVLKTNGLAAIIAPSRGQVHRFPTDCWRFYPDGLPALVRYAGLKLVESHVQESYAYPGRYQWGHAVAIARRPARNAEEEQVWAARIGAAKLVIRPKLAPADVSDLRFEARAKPPSLLKPMKSLDTIARRERERIAGLNPFKARASVVYWQLRAALRVLRKPFAKLSDFDR
jgi:SAM-dependent methyltransferase